MSSVISTVVCGCGFVMSKVLQACWQSPSVLASMVCSLQACWHQWSAVSKRDVQGSAVSKRAGINGMCWACCQEEDERACSELQASVLVPAASLETDSCIGHRAVFPADHHADKTSSTELLDGGASVPRTESCSSCNVPGGRRRRGRPKLKKSQRCAEGKRTVDEHQ